MWVSEGAGAFELGRGRQVQMRACGAPVGWISRALGATWRRGAGEAGGAFCLLLLLFFLCSMLYSDSDKMLGYFDALLHILSDGVKILRLLVSVQLVVGTYNTKITLLHNVIGLT